jgi:hypothetical protein
MLALPEGENEEAIRIGGSYRCSSTGIILGHKGYLSPKMPKKLTD